MISRAILLTGRRTIRHYMRCKSASASEAEGKLKFFDPFKEGQDIFYSAFNKDQNTPSNEKNISPENTKNPNVEKDEKQNNENQKDNCPKKEVISRMKVLDPCGERKRNPCGGGSDGPPNGPEDTIGPKRSEFPGKVRMGFIPEEWFQFFYPKTGVTGPYMFGVGLLTYLTSKEIYIMDHEYYIGLSFAILLITMVKKLGPPTANYADRLIDNAEKDWENMHKIDLENLRKGIEEERKEQWRADGALMLVDAKKDMINMQLEAAYREQIMKVYKEVIERLDYQVELANAEHRMNHKHMMFW